jgi:1,4-alpha-glucan branching enzyme
VANNQDCQTSNAPFKQYDYQIKTILPALGALIIKPEKIKMTRKKAVKKA